MNIVVRSPNWIGDFVLSVPAVSGLRKRFADASITLVAHKRLGLIASMVKEVDRVVEFDPGTSGRSLRGLRRFSMGISESPIDLSLIFPLSFSSALMSYFSGARRRAGYSTEMRGFLLTDRIGLPSDYRTEHLSVSYGRLARLVGVNGELSHPKLDVPAVCDSAERILAGCGVAEGERLIGIAPFAAYGPAKRWPMERFLEIAEAAMRAYGTRTLVFGSEGDADRFSLSPHLRDCLIDLTGRLTLKEAAYVLSRIACLVSNDTGIAHVAAAAGTPVVSIFGSTSPDWTAPIGGQNVVLCEKMDCSPCFERKCRFGHYRCLRGVPAERVLDSVRKILCG